MGKSLMVEFCTEIKVQPFLSDVAEYTRKITNYEFSVNLEFYLMSGSERFPAPTALFPGSGYRSFLEYGLSSNVSIDFNEIPLISATDCYSMVFAASSAIVIANRCNGVIIDLHGAWSQNEENIPSEFMRKLIVTEAPKTKNEAFQLCCRKFPVL